MAFDTRVYAHDPVDYRDVFLRCNQLIGAHEGIRFTDRDGHIGNERHQGLDALLDIYYGKHGRPLRRGKRNRVPCWLEVSFETELRRRGYGELHARLVGDLGRWLDGRRVRWSWMNHYLVEVYPGYEGLEELAAVGAPRRRRLFR